MKKMSVATGNQNADMLSVNLDKIPQGLKDYQDFSFFSGIPRTWDSDKLG